MDVVVYRSKDEPARNFRKLACVTGAILCVLLCSSNMLWDVLPFNFLLS